MAHVFQIGVGSGGMAVLDAVARDLRVAHVTLVDPDVFQAHNVDRHLFGRSGVGRLKVDLAKAWLLDRRPDLIVEAFAADVTAECHQATIETHVRDADLGICAADNESAKFHFDALMRKHAKPWTLGEVLAGGIGGFAHRFVPSGPCYGCVASFLKRSVTVEADQTPDYSQPGGAIASTRIPANRTSIAIIAGLHAQITLELLGNSPHRDFTSLLFSLERVPGIFEQAFRAHRFQIPRLAGCLICANVVVPENLDAELERALERLGHD